MDLLPLHFWIVSQAYSTKPWACFPWSGPYIIQKGVGYSHTDQQAYLGFPNGFFTVSLMLVNPPSQIFHVPSTLPLPLSICSLSPPFKLTVISQ